MSCQVPYCPDVAPENGLCKAHLKVWEKALILFGDDAYAAWLKAQSDELLDVCPTPAALAAEICRRVESNVIGAHAHSDFEHAPFRVLEPSAGDGAFVRAARATWPQAHISAIEIRPEAEQALLDAGADDVSIGDMKALTMAGARGADLVIGNPPFGVAEEHIRHLLGNMKTGSALAFILRLGFYESKERLPFWQTFPESYFMPIVPRPSYKLNKKGEPGTDSQAYGVFIWQKRDDSVVFGAPPIRLPHLVWDNGKRKGRCKKKEQGERGAVEATNGSGEDAPELE